MKKLFTKVALVSFLLTSTCFSTSFAADGETSAKTAPSAVETAATTETKNAVSVGLEEAAILPIIGGVIILGVVAISSESEGVSTAHLNGHGHVD